MPAANHGALNQPPGIADEDRPDMPWAEVPDVQPVSGFYTASTPEGQRQAPCLILRPAAFCRPGLCTRRIAEYEPHRHKYPIVCSLAMKAQARRTSWSHVCDEDQSSEIDRTSFSFPTTTSRSPEWITKWGSGTKTKAFGCCLTIATMRTP